MTQQGIRQDVPDHSRYLSFSLAPDADADDILAGLVELVDGTETVVGIGTPLVQLLASQIPDLRRTAPREEGSPLRRRDAGAVHRSLGPAEC